MLTPSIPVTRWCLRCRGRFEVSPLKPRAFICADCAATHPDRRVRDDHPEVPHVS